MELLYNDTNTLHTPVAYKTSAKGTLHERQIATHERKRKLE